MYLTNVLDCASLDSFLIATMNRVLRSRNVNKFVLVKKKHVKKNFSAKTIGKY
jgi:hypothetical protein